MDPDQELVSALKDVPGFSLDEGPSRVDLPAVGEGESPAGEGGPEDVVGVDLPSDEEPAPDEEAAQQDVEAEDSAWASAIDPSLLEAESGRKKVDTLVLLGVTALLGVVILLVFAFLT